MLSNRFEILAKLSLSKEEYVTKTMFLLAISKDIQKAIVLRTFV